MRDPEGCGARGERWLGRDPPGRAGTFLCLNRDVGRGRLGAALALLAALAVDGVVRLQLSVRLLGAGEGAEDPVPCLPVGTAWIRPPPSTVLQQVGAGTGGLWGCSHLGLAWQGGRTARYPPRALPAALCQGTNACPVPCHHTGTWSPAGDGVASGLGSSDANRCMVQEGGDGKGDAEEETAGGKEIEAPERGRDEKKEQERKTCHEGCAATAKTLGSPGLPALPAQAGGMTPPGPTGVGAEARRGTLAPCRGGKRKARGCFQLRATPVAKPPSHEP